MNWLALLYRRFVLGIPPEQWSAAEVWQEKTLIDGTRASGTLMSRYVAGAWQYRRQTDDEAQRTLEERAL